MKSNVDTKPLYDPTSDINWLKAKIELWERAEREARQQLNAAQNQLAYYRQWYAELTGSEAQR